MHAFTTKNVEMRRHNNNNNNNASISNIIRKKTNVMMELNQEVVVKYNVPYKMTTAQIE